MRWKYIEKIDGASAAKMEKNSSTQTRTEILRLTRLIVLPLSYRGLGPTHEPEDILTISLQLWVRHTDATSAFSASPTAPPRSDPQTRAVKEDINWSKWRRNILKKIDRASSTRMEKIPQPGLERNFIEDTHKLKNPSKQDMKVKGRKRIEHLWPNKKGYITTLLPTYK